jgi:hypothetical protein
MKRKISCPSCGVNLKPDAYYCDYCGTFFEKKQNQIESEQLKRINADHNQHELDRYDMPREDHVYENDRFENQKFENEKFESQFEENEVSYVKPQTEDMTDKEIDATWNIQNSKLNNMLRQYNMSSGIFGFVIFSIIAFVMFSGAMVEAPFLPIIGIIIIGSFGNRHKTKKQALEKLYNSGYYQKAYDLLQTMKNTSLKAAVIKQQILLNFYRLNNEAEARFLILQLKKINVPLDGNITKIARELGV